MAGNEELFMVVCCVGYTIVKFLGWVADILHGPRVRAPRRLWDGVPA